MSTCVHISYVYVLVLECVMHRCNIVHLHGIHSQHTYVQCTHKVHTMDMCIHIWMNVCSKICMSPALQQSFQHMQHTCTCITYVHVCACGLLWLHVDTTFLSQACKVWQYVLFHSIVHQNGRALTQMLVSLLSRSTLGHLFPLAQQWR